MKRPMRSAYIAALVLIFGGGTPASGQESTPGGSEWVGRPDFWVATAANLAGIGLFVARVHAPAAAPAFGYATQAIGIAALAFGISDLVRGNASATTAGLLAYGFWALGAAVIDHVLQIEYRDPRNPAVLAPYVVFYYVGIGVLSATQLENGTAPWAIAGASCLLNVAASFYARARGAD